MILAAIQKWAVRDKLMVERTFCPLAVADSNL